MVSLFLFGSAGGYHQWMTILSGQKNHLSSTEFPSPCIEIPENRHMEDLHEQFLNHYRLGERTIYISFENWRSPQPWEFYSSMHLIPPLENSRSLATHQFAHYNHPFTTRTRSTCAPHQLETSFTLVHHLIIRRAFIGSGLFLDGRTPYT